MKFLKRNIGRIVLTGLVLVILFAWFARPPFSWTFGLLILVGAFGALVTDANYAARRIFSLIPVLLIVSFVVFSLMSSLPGDPALTILGAGATAESIAQLNQELGFDQPFFNRYGNWMGDVIVGDLGTSRILREDVADGISRSITPTLQLMAYSLILAVLIAVPAGMYSGYKNGTRQDRIISYTMLGFLAIPNFVLALVLVLFLAVGGITIFGIDIGFRWLPAARYVPIGAGWSDHLKHMLLPSLSLAMSQAAVFMRLLRSDMIGTLRLPFIDLARSKGLKTGRILFRHALRPSSFTLITVMGLSVGSLIGGALITEYVFTLPGVGSYIFTGIFKRDFVAVQGAVLVISTLFVVVLTFSDLLYLALDPRLKHQSEAA